jgi:large subunit ribosomal protein L29
MADKKKEKKVTSEDLRAKSPDELNKMLVDMKKQQMNMRFQKAGGQLNNTAEMRAVRRSVARVNTILTEKATTETSGKTAKAAAPAKKKASAKAKKTVAS